MKKLLLLAFVLCAATFSFGQCDKDPAGGTSCVPPLKTKAVDGQSPTFMFDIIPASTNAPCIKLVAGSPYYRMCGQNLAFTVDYGDGKGFVSLKGIDGIDGKNGLSATVAVGTVTSGTAPAVINSGTDNFAILNFVLPKGDKGTDGLPGVIVGQTATFGPLSCPKGGKGTIVAGFTAPAGCTAKITGIK